MLTLACALAVALASTQNPVPVQRLPAPVIDGVIGENEWRDAARVTLDHQTQPGDNTAPSQATEVRISYGETDLYVSFVATDDPDAVRARVTRRDDIAGDDFVMLYLDTYNDRRRAYVFWFNPFGIQADGIFTEGVATGRNFDGNIDRSWDGVLESKGQRTATGYVVEARIPFSTLRFPRQEIATWGLHLERWIARDGERISWQPISRAVSSLLTQMGTVTGLRVPRTGPAYEVIPTMLTTVSEEGATAGRDESFDAGLTGSWSVTPNLTISATANPDFSQIESDVPQIEVNQRFPLRYAEKRPFFYEGGQYFQSAGSLSLLDTRQIVDPGWGVKLAGKTGRSSIGLLASADGAPGRRVAAGASGAGDSSSVVVARYQRDLFKNSTVGAFGTDYRFAGMRNTVVSADGQLRLPLNTIGFQMSRSETTAPSGAASTGSASYLWYDFVGRHWRVFVNNQHVSDDYDNRVAFVRRRGYQMNSTTLGYEFQAPTSTWWVRARPFVVARRLETSAGLVDESYADPGIDIRLARDISIYTYYSFHQDAYLGQEYRYQFYANNFTVNAFKRVTLGVRLLVGEGVNFDPARPMVGEALDATVTVGVKPVAALDSEFLWINSQLTVPETRDLLFRQRVFRNRTNYQFTREHGVRTIAEYNTFTRQLSVSLLYGWTPRPATSFYLGYGDLLDRDALPGQDHRTSDQLQRVRRTLFAKLSYGWAR